MHSSLGGKLNGQFRCDQGENGVLEKPRESVNLAQGGNVGAVVQWPGRKRRQGNSRDARDALNLVAYK